jgi:hypothetical protein
MLAVLIFPARPALTAFNDIPSAFACIDGIDQFSMLLFK